VVTAIEWRAERFYLSYFRQEHSCLQSWDGNERLSVLPGCCITWSQRECLHAPLWWP